MWRVIGVIVVCALLGFGCGSASSTPSDEQRSSGARTDTSSGSDETAPVASSSWLRDVHQGDRLEYDVTLGDEHARVAMEVQQVVRRGQGVAVRLAPIGTPLGDEPIYPRWLVADAGELMSLEETAALTTQAGWAPIDEAGHVLIEAADNVEWRVPERWLTAGRASTPGDEVSSGWSLEERVGDVSEPIAAHDCVRLTRSEGAERLALLICANVGIVESIRRDDAGEVVERWSMVAVSAAPPRSEAAF